MQKALFLYNPAAGRGRIARNVGGIVDIFSENGWELTPEKIDFGRNPFDAHPDIRMVVAAGGDGTVNYVVNRMRERGLSLELGIIPAGTANDFAGIVGMAKNPLEAARQIVTGEVQALDCGVVNGLHFVNIFSFGIFTTTSQRTPDERKHRLGKLAYIMEGIKELRHMHAIPLHVRTENGEFDFNSWHSSSTAKRPAGSGWPTRRACATEYSTACCSKSATSSYPASPWYATSAAAIPAASGTCAQRRCRSPRPSTNPPTSTASGAPASRSTCAACPACCAWSARATAEDNPARPLPYRTDSKTISGE